MQRQLLRLRITQTRIIEIVLISTSTFKSRKFFSFLLSLPRPVLSVSTYDIQQSFTFDLSLQFFFAIQTDVCTFSTLYFVAQQNMNFFK